MIFRQLAASVLVAALSAGTGGQQPQAPPHDENDPRYHIQIDVSATVPDNERWVELQSRNFVLAGTVQEDELRKVGADLELFRDTFSQYNPRLKGVSPTTTTVLVFRDAESFRWYRPEKTNLPETAKAYLKSNADKTYMVLQQTGTLPREIYRSYVLQLIPQAMEPVPLWFREGLADYFSTMKVDRALFSDKRWVHVGSVISDYDRLLGSKANLLPVETMFRVHEESPEYTNPEARKLFLAESWGIVHYLMTRPNGSAAMQRLFNLLGDGDTLENAATKALGRTLKQFESDYQQHIRFAHDRRLWTGTTLLLTKSSDQVAKGKCEKVLVAGSLPQYYPQCYRKGDSADPPGISRIPYALDHTWNDVFNTRVYELNEAASWFYRGDLMLHIGRLGEADAYLQRALRQPPESSRTWAAMGVLQLYQERYTDSEKSLQRALELDPQNYMAHYYRALQIRLKGLHEDTILAFEDLEDIHKELLQTISLAPHFVEATEMLSVMNLLRQTSSMESQKNLMDAIRRYPGRGTLWVSLANVSARLGDAPSTRWLLTRLLSAGAPDAATRKSAVSLLEGIAPGASRAIITMPPQAAVPAGVLQSSPTLAPPVATSANNGPGEKLIGMLTNIECHNGLTLTVKSEGKTLKLHTRSALSVQFASRNRDGRTVSADPVVCGPTTQEGLNVTITYHPLRSGDSIGEPLAVDVLVND
jgi:tetratricopeptide (TPR) repeat protein